MAKLAAAHATAKQATVAGHASYRRDLVPVGQEAALVVWKTAAACATAAAANARRMG